MIKSSFMEFIMAIPDYQSIMLPLLKFLSDGEVHSKRNVVEHLSSEFRLSTEEKTELLPSGKQPVFSNRVGWARTYLKKAGLIESVKHGYFRITERGKDVLAQNPKRIDNKFLDKFPEFREFKGSGTAKKEVKIRKSIPLAQSSPEELIDAIFKNIDNSLADDILQTFKDCSPAFFERLVVDVLVKMGYGGSRREAGKAIGGKGDEGIDGIIKEDKLGLDIIYIQAKRWQGTVGRPEIQKFAGALQGQRARKGIFITTSDFTKEAQSYVTNIESKIILIDGHRLAELMIEHNVGVSPVASYEIKKIDSDYFIED
jgi:restriction system protein